MNDSSEDYYCSCFEYFLTHHVPSRLAARDASLYDFASGLADYAARYLGWTSLSSRPPMSAEKLMFIAADIRRSGLEAIVLLGQGGSSQASMTVTKLHEASRGRLDVAFRTMDSLSPVFVNHILGSSDPARTLYIISSKSGSTIEPLMLERVTWQYVLGHLDASKAAERFVAITDSGSLLEQLARDKNYRLILASPHDVGGRFSALSVFGLFPAALVGIDIVGVVAAAAAIEASCSADDPENPALDLACFLYENYRNGRDKVTLVMPPSGQVFGLWIEQMLAESLGKNSGGILPNVEVDASILSVPRVDRCCITYEVGDAESFCESLQNFDASIPARHFVLNSVEDLFAQFIIWEYAIAFLGILLKVNPFDQPNVEDTKKRVKRLLLKRPDSLPVCDDYIQINFPPPNYIRTLCISKTLLASDSLAGDLKTVGLCSVDSALRLLLASLSPGDYFSLNAFLPFREYGRREALERMRNRVASRLGVASCLEIGPRYLHSTGQLHKGGSNNGVFLYLSADEENDVVIPGETFTLGELAATQALGDFEAVSARDRRAVLVHLAGNNAETLSRFADRVCSAISAIKRPI